jgi:hypothetical protein
LAKIRVFASFDIEHDRDLYEQLLAQSQQPGSGFEITACSAMRSRSDLWDDALRAALGRVDEVIVLCGLHSGESMRMSAELNAAREVNLPYFLLWGRRELMCAKPGAAKNDDGMYSWTPQILADQVLVTMRRAGWSEALAPMRRAPLVRPTPTVAAVPDASRRS